MANNNVITIKGINNLSDAQKQAIADLMQVDVSLIQDVKKASTVNHLQMKDGSDTIAIDKFSQEEFDITQLTEDELMNAKKTGLSPKSYEMMQIGLEIKKSVGRISTRGVRTGISAGQQIRDIVNQYVDKIDNKAIALLTDKDYSKKNMSLAYPLFIRIPDNADDTIKKEIRKVKGANRFASTVYKFKNADGEYFMTNDLYAKNIDKVAMTFENMFKTDKKAKKVSTKKA